jgi:hypothetical protein
MMSGFIGGEYGIAMLRFALALRFAFAAPDAPPNDLDFAIGVWTTPNTIGMSAVAAFAARASGGTAGRYARSKM